MGNIIQIKRGTAVQVGAASLAEGELCIDLDNQLLYYGDGNETKGFNYITEVQPQITFYGVCNTSATTAAKILTVDDDFELKTGILILVKFTYANTAQNPTLNVNGSGAKIICVNGSTSIGNNKWLANEVLFLVYDGTSWMAISKVIASTNQYGITKLSNALDSTSEIEAATSYAVKQAYDRNSWDSISLTSPLSIENGGTGASTIAGIRTTLNAENINNKVNIMPDSPTNDQYPTVSLLKTTAEELENQIAGKDTNYYYNPSGTSTKIRRNNNVVTFYLNTSSQTWSLSNTQLSWVVPQGFRPQEETPFIVFFVES